MPRRLIIAAIGAGACCLVLWCFNAARHAPDRATAQTVSPADRLQELTARLQPIPAAQGGGYFLDWELCQVRDDDLVDVVRIPGIRHLYDNGFGPVAWAQFGRLAPLEALETGYVYLTDDELSCLNDLQRLERLVLRSTVHRPGPVTSPGRPGPSFSAASLEPLRRMRHLKNLELRSDGLTDEALAQVGAATGLITLTLEGHFTSAGLKHLSELTRLRRLSLDGDFDDDGLAELVRLTNLECLILKSDRLRGPGLDHLARLPGLRMCKLGRMRSATTLASLQDWPALVSLNLADDSVTDALLLTLPEMGRLRSLSLHGTPVTDAGMASLPRLHGLAELDLNFTRVTDAGLDHVTAVSTLKALRLGDSGRSGPIREAGLRKLSQLPHLEALVVGYIDLSDVDLEVFELSSLRRLDVGGNALGPRAREFAQLYDKLGIKDRSSQIVLQANLMDEEAIRRYDIYADRLEVELPAP